MRLSTHRATVPTGRTLLRRRTTTDLICAITEGRREARRSPHRLSYFHSSHHSVSATARTSTSLSPRITA
jgi:hypothetical protein